MMRFSLFLVLLVAPLPLFAQSYVRAGFGIERSGGVTLRDVDCGSTQPPALFGCDDGPDGLPFGARGDFGSSAAVEIALGRKSGRGRGELVVTTRGFQLDAGANFTGVTGHQPVNADLRATSAMLAFEYDVAPEGWHVRPFVTAGAGLSHNEIGSITFSFPGIAPDAVTILRGGTETDFAWRAGAGLAFLISKNLTLDLTAHYNDLGAVRTKHGNATIIRPNRRLELDIAAVETELETTGVTLSLRQRF
jgi:opacity protein-like surface antigen